MLRSLENISADRPVLIAGPTASGKSALALHLAERFGGQIINADALQVFACWSVLSARPGADDLSRCPHHLYGHVPYDQIYSTGQWLREVTPFLNAIPRPIIVGGTGLNFTALTEGLADIPAIPQDIRVQANALSLTEMINTLDAPSRDAIDLANRARVQRAYEVLTATGRSLLEWQEDTPAPLLPAKTAHRFVLDAPKEWLTPRIEQRFDAMLDGGALDEVRAVMPDWDPTRPASKAIGAPELVAYLKGTLSLDAARERASIATRQYAKRQRSWFRARMAAWDWVSAAEIHKL